MKTCAASIKPSTRPSVETFGHLFSAKPLQDSSLSPTFVKLKFPTFLSQTRFCPTKYLPMCTSILFFSNGKEQDLSHFPQSDFSPSVEKQMSTEIIWNCLLNSFRFPHTGFYQIFHPETRGGVGVCHLLLLGRHCTCSTIWAALVSQPAIVRTITITITPVAVITTI